MKNLDQKIEEELVCKTCFLKPKLCLCSLIPHLELRTKVTLIIHNVELNRSSNTGRLALEALINSEMRIRGQKGNRLDLSDLVDGDYEPLLLYPSEDAHEFTPEFLNGINKKINLLVPDGNWRQARKIHTRHKELKMVKRVKVSRKQKDSFYMRSEHMSDGMATMQAIALALGVIEGQEVQEKLLGLYYEKLNRTFETRSIFTYQK